MTLPLTTSIRLLKGMGPKTAVLFENHGIATLEDLLTFYPRSWNDARHITPIDQLRSGSPFLIQAAVVRVQEGRSQRTRAPYLRALVADTSGSLEVLWFHSPYLKQKLKPGSQWLLYGLIQGWRAAERTMMAPKFLAAPTILPVYSEIGGVSSLKIQSFMEQARSSLALVTDYLSPPLRAKLEVISLGEALEAMHFPTTMEQLLQARKRLGFDELMLLAAPSLLAKQARDQELGEGVALDPTVLTNWEKNLPFRLTGDQKQVIQTIGHDLAAPRPMNRLLQGDVGSGKTVVALAAAIQVAQAGKQTIWLAPTELLARQHFATAQRLLGADAGVTAVGLLTRTTRLQLSAAGEVKATREALCDLPLIIGTHALLHDELHFPRLGLLVIDEQHRFGVKQRAQLRLFAGRPIHLLSMTATPIPRTMALLLYGDLELSVIKEKPVGRKPVVTRVVASENRLKAYDFINTHVEHSSQVYVVCPLIDPPEDKGDITLSSLFDTVEEKKAVTTWQQEIQTHFPGRRIGILHGKLKAEEKQATMGAFRQGEIDILVTTSVIEVGVDVPNATIMVIENAERFGLAQLHQLRGRVGRGETQSFCFLFPSTDDQKDNARLQIMEQTSDGFILAEKDLELRGPGQITGLAQSGMPQLRFASFNDLEQIQTIKAIAQELVQDPHFLQFVDRFWRAYHPE